MDLKTAFKDYFKVGAAISLADLETPAHMQFLKDQFNSFTVENDMKPCYFLDPELNRDEPEKYDTAPALCFEYARPYLEAAKKMARFGKKTVIKIFSNAGIKLTVKAKNARAKNKKFVKIKNGKTAKLTFSKKAVKGKYTFTVTSPDVGVKTITVRVK